MFSNHWSDKELIPKIDKDLLILNSKKANKNKNNKIPNDLMEKKDLNKHFSKKDIQIANKQMKNR
jgi:hypothetical protein